MGRKVKPAPFKEQDKLNEDLLKIKGGNYIQLSMADYYIEGDKEWATPTQDKLEQGLIKFTNDSYYHIDSIKKVEESSCFVATTVYGDINAPQVEALRGFRDDVLIQSKVGRAFVNFYYSGVGEKTANLIKEHLSSAIPSIRKGLDTLIEKYSGK